MVLTVNGKAAAEFRQRLNVGCDVQHAASLKAPNSVLTV
jgi:hypothetical protein